MTVEIAHVGDGFFFSVGLTISWLPVVFVSFRTLKDVCYLGICFAGVRFKNTELDDNELTESTELVGRGGKSHVGNIQNVEYKVDVFTLQSIGAKRGVL